MHDSQTQLQICLNIVVIVSNAGDLTSEWQG